MKIRIFSPGLFWEPWQSAARRSANPGILAAGYADYDKSRYSECQRCVTDYSDLCLLQFRHIPVSWSCKVSATTRSSTTQ